MNNKILIELEIPIIEKKYDLFIPINKTIGTVKSLIEQGLSELTNEAYTPSDQTNLYSKESGEFYDINMIVRETDLKNGSRVILV